MPRIVDLSMPIDEHFRWPLQFAVRGDLIKGDQYRVTVVTMPVHAFTHMDAPAHMVSDGAAMAETSLEQTCGRCAVVDVSDVTPNEGITADRLTARGGHVQAGGLVLLKTCWDRQRSWSDPAYWTEAPWLTRDAAEWLAGFAPRAVAFDFPQDHPIRLSVTGGWAPIDQHVTHDVLLRRGTTLVEYLCNVDAVAGPFTELMALPLKIPKADGAPARVIALEPADD